MGNFYNFIFILAFVLILTSHYYSITHTAQQQGTFVLFVLHTLLFVITQTKNYMLEVEQVRQNNTSEIENLYINDIINKKSEHSKLKLPTQG